MTSAAARFDVTVVKYTPTHFQVLAHRRRRGARGASTGNDRLLDFVCDEYQAKYGTDPRQSPQAVQILRNDCDAAKVALSEAPRTMVTFRHDGKTVAVQVTREQFEDMTADLLQRTYDTTELVLQQGQGCQGRIGFHRARRRLDADAQGACHVGGDHR